MLFLTLSNANIRFAEGDIFERIYTATNALLTTKKVQIIDQKKFIEAALNQNKKVFIIHIAIITSEIAIHLACLVQIVLLKAKKAPVIIPEEYSDYANIISEKLAVVLSEYIKINTHTINLKKDKQPPYELIHSLGLVELKILKIYIQTNLDNIFIQPFKFPAGAFILFDQKFNRSF